MSPARWHCLSVPLTLARHYDFHWTNSKLFLTKKILDPNSHDELHEVPYTNLHFITAVVQIIY